MKECWINVYYYKPLDQTYNSHKFHSEFWARMASKNKFPKYKTLYRIHVKLK